MEEVHNDTNKPSSPGTQDRTSRNNQEQNYLLSREERPNPSDAVSQNDEIKPLAPNATIRACCSNIKPEPSGYIIRLMWIYTSVAAASWLLICLMTSHPLTVGQYTFDYREPGRHKGYRAETLDRIYVQIERVYTIARTMQSVVGLVTIPLTSAVCSAAAASFAQSNSKKRELTMRQLLTLADKGWSDPTIIGKVMIGKGAKISSSFLVAAILLTTFGESISTLQNRTRN